jgi:hypothetical protein
VLHNICCDKLQCMNIYLDRVPVNRLVIGFMTTYAISAYHH